MTKLLKSNWIFILGLIALGVVTRTVGHVAPNFEFVTAASLLAAATLPRKISWLVPLAIMATSDFILGNTSIFLFTWSGFLLTWVIGIKAGGMNQSSIKTIGKYAGVGIASVVAFFLWTNLGVVLTTNMYQVSLAGYMQSLVMALPFLKVQLVSAVITVPIVFGIYTICYNWALSASSPGGQLNTSRK